MARSRPGPRLPAGRRCCLQRFPLDGPRELRQHSKANAHHHKSGTSKKCTSCTRNHHGRIARSERARHDFMRQSGYPHSRPGYVVDHVKPLECGGADVFSNMTCQTIAEAKAKDRTERACR